MNRCVPVYVILADSAEFPVSDLVDVRFEFDLSAESALALLESNGLSFVDSSDYRHNLWKARLHDSIKISPLAYANSLHLEDATAWAAPTMHVAPVLMSDPTDEYFQYQYYLKNTGQTGGAADADIDAELAWEFTLGDSTLRVAVIDDGLVAHGDLQSSRLLPGYDFFHDNDDPSPGEFRNHGMACTGILAASHNDGGVVGVFGSCEIVPVKIFSDFGEGTDTISLADAIYFAYESGARVMSNSWGYRGRTTPIPIVQDAIRHVTDACDGWPTKSSSGPRRGSVMVFAAGTTDLCRSCFPPICRK